MDWLRRNVSSSSLTQKTKKNPFQSESESMATSTWLEAFKSHWSQAEKAMTAVYPPKGLNSSQNGKAVGSHASGDLATEVFRHFEQMNLFFLTELAEQTGEAQLSPILDFIFTVNCYERLVYWGLGSHMAEFTDFSKMSMLKLFELLVSQPQQSLLVHKPLLTPLLKLLEGCSRLVPSDVEKHFVVVLNQVCVNISHDTTLLEFFFIPQLSSESGPPKFSVFTLLIDFLYRDGNIGQLARDALLLILAVSRLQDSVGLFIADHSNFCPVVATGLNGLFSMLPRKITVGSDDWSRLTNEDIESIPFLQDFFGALEFCNAVVQVGHKSVVDQLLEYIHQGFLVPVLTSALLENSVEDVIAATAYLELFLRTVTEVSFMKVFIRFILCESHNGVPLLETLVTRISSNSRLCLVSLSLFDTLLSLHCEDLMYELILKYLTPCTHLMVSHTKAIREFDMYGETAGRFLSLIPTCCRSSRSNSLLDTSGEVHQTEEAQSNGDWGAVPTAPKQKFSFSGSAENGIEYGTDTSVASDSSGSEHLGSDKVDPNFGDYLHSAYESVHRSYAACQSWSLPYDGDVPDPLGFRDDETLSPTSSSDSNSDRFSNCNSLTVAPPKTPTGTSLFSRQMSIRKSVRTNSYFGVRHSSALYIGSVPEEFNHVDLSLGPGQWVVDMDKFEEDEMFGEEENKPIDPHEEESSQVVAEQLKIRSELNSAESSAQSTPAKQANRMGASMPTDYFKLAYDEDSLPGRSSTSDSQDETESSSQMLSWSFVGWSQIGDINTFIEVLHRVAPSKAAVKSSMDDNLAFLDSVYSKSVGNDQSGANDLTLKAEEELNTQNTPEVSFRPGAIGEAKLDAKQISPSTDSGIDGGLGVFRGSFKNPNIGPFLSVLMHKLENMMQNSLFVNLQLTAVVSCLAAYPQPLIHSFLLNHNVVFQPSIRSLWQILSSLKKRIDSYVYTVDNFEVLLWKGRKFLELRERKYSLEQSDRSQLRKSRGNSLLQAKETDVVEVTAQHQNSVKKPHRYGVRPLEFNLNWHGPRSKRLPTTASSTSTAVDEAQLLRTKNVVYCAIVLEEFLKELAAISLEHNVAQKTRLKCEEFLGH